MRSYHDQWFNGYMAARSGQDKVNPYNPHSLEWQAWEEGWNDYHTEREER